MSFRITTSPDGKKTTIRVEGHLDARAVPDLQRDVQLAKAPIELELSGMISADAEGIRKLQTLSAQGAKLCGASPYIRVLLAAP